MQTIEPLLEVHPFFKGIESAYLKVVSGCASEMQFESGQFLFKEGERADKFFVIKSGRVPIEIYSPKQGQITIHTEQAGEIVGWSWLVAPYYWHFDARATEPTNVFAIDGKCLREMCENDRNMGYELMRRFALIIAERLEATRFQLLDVYEK